MLARGVGTADRTGQAVDARSPVGGGGLRDVQETSPTMSDPASQSERLAREIECQTLSEARLGAVLDTAVFPIIVIDEQARMLIYNKACDRVFGYAAEEAIGQYVKPPARKATAAPRR